MFVFANLNKSKSKAETNFEIIFKNKNIGKNYQFKKPGQHRAYKVIEASKYAYFGVINKTTYRKSLYIKLFKDYRCALEWAKKKYKKEIKIDIIPSGFMLLPEKLITPNIN